MSKLITIEDGYEIRLGQKNPTCYPCCFEGFVGSENHYEIIANEYPPILEQPRFVWDIMIKCVETGTLVLYRMIESPLNSMYISK